MSSAQTVAKNTFYLFSSDVIGRIFSFLLIIFIARKLGDYGFGEYSFAFSFVGLFAIFSDLGISTYLVREIAKDKKNIQKLFLDAFSLKLLLGLVTIIIPSVIILMLGKSLETIIVVWMASISLFFGNYALIFKALFQGNERLGLYALIDLTERTTTFILGITVLYLGFGITTLFVVLIISYLLSFVVGMIITTKAYTKLRLTFNWKNWTRLIKESLPFWLTMLFMSIYFNIGNVILSKFADFSVVGLYNAAYKIIYAVFFIPLVLTAVVFPTLSKFHAKEKNLQKLLFQKSFYYMVAVAVPLMIGGIFLADKMITFAYGAEFMNAVPALKILLCSIIFIFVNYLMGYLLNSINKQKIFMYTTMISTGINVILNFLLIPKYSFIGASIAVVATELINFIILYYFINKYKFKMEIAKILLNPLISALIMLGVLWYFKETNIIIMVGLGAAIYFLVFYLIRGIGNDEIELAKKLIM